MFIILNSEGHIFSGIDADYLYSHVKFLNPLKNNKFIDIRIFGDLQEAQNACGYINKNSNNQIELTIKEFTF